MLLHVYKKGKLHKDINTHPSDPQLASPALLLKAWKLGFRGEGLGLGALGFRGLGCRVTKIPKLLPQAIDPSNRSPNIAKGLKTPGYP